MGVPAQQGPSRANSGPTSELGLSPSGGVGRSRHSKGMIRCKWFNAVYLEKGKVFRPGQTVFFYGKVDRDPYGTGNFQIIQPQFEIVQESEPGSESETKPLAEASLQIGRMVPIYQSVGALGSRVLRRLVWGALIDELITRYDNNQGTGCQPVLLLIDEAGRTAIPTLADYLLP